MKTTTTYYYFIKHLDKYKAYREIDDGYNKRLFMHELESNTWTDAEHLRDVFNFADKNNLIYTEEQMELMTMYEKNEAVREFGLKMLQDNELKNKEKKSN
jgi:hypothetical protein